VTEHFPIAVMAVLGSLSLSLPLLLLLLSSLSSIAPGVAQAATPGATDLCYELAWDLASPQGPQTRIIRPVTAFPKEHVLVQRSVCGKQYSTGDRIPATGLSVDALVDACAICG